MPVHGLLEQPLDEQAEPPAESGEGWRAGTILAIGLILAIASEPLAKEIHGRLQPPWTEIVSVLGYGFEHLGVVLVVAMLIRVAIEKNSQQQFINLINTRVRNQIRLSVRKSVVKPLLPIQRSIKKMDDEFGFRITKPGLLDDQSINELKEKVLSPKFFRSGYTLHLTLEPLFQASLDHKQNGQMPDLVKVQSRITYRVKNITDQPANYSVKAWIDRMFEPADLAEEHAGRFVRLVCGPEDLKDDTQLRPYDIPKLIEQKKIVRDDNAVRLDYDLQNGIPPQMTYYVEIVGSQVLRSSDLFVWNMGALTHHLYVSVELAGGFTSNDFIVNARELHHISSKDFAATFSQQGNTFSWQINQVLLPYQGVEIWWLPRPPVTSNEDKSATLSAQRPALPSHSNGAEA